MFFPAVELNDGSTRPNLIGAPEIRKIVDGANSGLLPKINLVQWDNPLGLGSWKFDKPFDPIATFKGFGQSITFFDDMKMIDSLVAPMLFPGYTNIGDGLLGQLGLKKPKSNDPVIDPIPDPDGPDLPGGGDDDEVDGEGLNAGQQEFQKLLKATEERNRKQLESDQSATPTKVELPEASTSSEPSVTTPEPPATVTPVVPEFVAPAPEPVAPPVTPAAPVVEPPAEAPAAAPLEMATAE